MHDTATSGLLQIDLQQIINDRVPASRRRWIPRALIRRLARLVRQDELNGILRRTYPARGVEFASAALQDLRITTEVRGLDNIPVSGRCIFASNHPLGGLDGIALISVLGKKYGDDGIRFPVNDLLMNVSPLRDIFIPVNKFGAQGRAGALLLQQAFASSRQILYFPAGLVSRLGKRGKIADLEWHKAFVTKAIEHKRSIVPVHFSGHNSMRFYRLARWRRRLHIPFNIEQVLLPSELIRASGSKFTITFGEPVSFEELKASHWTPAQQAARIRSLTYSLAP